MESLLKAGANRMLRQPAEQASQEEGSPGNFQKKEARYVDQKEVDCVEQRKSRKPFDYGIAFMKMRKEKKEGDANDNNWQEKTDSR